MKKLIITGCQRSGTMSVADAFQIAHEKQFTPFTDYSHLSQIITRLHSESSWLAVPFLSHLKQYATFIHLVRHPLKVINSLIGINFWTGDGHELYRNFIFKHSTIKRNQSPLDLSMNYWIEWNKKIPEGTPRIKLEDLKNFPKLNSRPKANLTSLEDSQHYPELWSLAWEYGYGESINETTCCKSATV